MSGKGEDIGNSSAQCGFHIEKEKLKQNKRRSWKKVCLFWKTKFLISAFEFIFLEVNGLMILNKNLKKYVVCWWKIGLCRNEPGTDRVLFYSFTSVKRKNFFVVGKALAIAFKLQ